MIETEEKSYDLQYGVKRIQMAEAALGNRSVIVIFNEQPSVKDLCTVAAYGLREDGKPGWVNPKQALDAVEAFIDSDEGGYVALYKEVAEAINRDCGFLFR